MNGLMIKITQICLVVLFLSSSSLAQKIPLYPSDTVYEIGSQKQLFLDQQRIEYVKGLAFKMHRPARTGEVLVAPDLPVERGGYPYLYSSVLKSESDHIQLWYDYYKPNSEDPYDHDRHVAYAESADGIHFTKPMIGRFEWQGNKENNIVIPGIVGGSSVWIDDQAPLQHRYKTQMKVYPSGEFHMYSSPDGKDWSLYQKIDPKGPHDTQTIIFWDHRINAYVFYGRYFINKGEYRERAVRRAIISEDFTKIENTGLVLWPDWRDRGKYSEVKPNGSAVDYYGATIFPYEGQYIMLAQSYWHWIPNTTYQGTDQPGMRDVRLAVSRDGQAFQWLGQRKAFMTPGPMGQFDSKQIWVMPNPIVMGDELWFYYSGINWDRAGRIDPQAQDQQKLGGISRAVLRLDGFVSLEAGFDEEGEVLTKSIRFSGDQLWVNANTGAGGYIKVEVLDPEGRVIPGFERENCQWIVGNGIKIPVVWKDVNISSLQGQTIRLKYIIQDGELYAYQFK